MLFFLETVLVFLIIYFILMGIYLLSETTTKLFEFLDKIEQILTRIQSLDQPQSQPQPQPQSHIENGTVILSNDSIQEIRNTGNCTICTEPLGDTISATTCGHIYHPNCIETWFTQQQRDNHSLSCPVCRAPVQRNETPAPTRRQIPRLRDLLNQFVQGDEMISIFAQLSE